MGASLPMLSSSSETRAVMSATNSDQLQIVAADGLGVYLAVETGVGSLQDPGEELRSERVSRESRSQS